MDALALAEAGATSTPDEQEQGPVPEGENKFQKAIAAWRGML
jgi:hypothetical protein